MLAMAKGSRRSQLQLAAIIIVIGLLGSVGTFVSFYTNWLWFSHLGFKTVFWRSLAAQWLSGLAFGFFAFIFMFVNLLVAKRLSPKLYYLTPKLSLQNLIRQFKPYLDRYFYPLTIIGSLVLALILAGGMASQWQTWLRYLFRAGSSIKDPILHRSLSFYFFVLPAYQSLQTYLIALVLITLIATIVIHILEGGLAPGLGRQAFAPGVKAHLSILGVLLLLSFTWGWQLEIYNLMYSPRGRVIYGASYADIHAHLPALQLLIVVSLATVILIIINIFRRGWFLPLIGIVATLVVWFVGVGLYPAIVQAYRVAPNEIAKEKPYIRHHIKYNRLAYGLDKVKGKDFPASQTLNKEKLASNKGTTDNIRLWDTKPLLKTYSQIQEIRLYYTFKDVDIDRYQIGNSYRQVAVSARELSVNQLPQTAQTWINQHMVFTHGYGLTVSPINEVSLEGLPELLVKDIPPRTVPQAKASLTITQPKIYYGEEGSNYVLVKTKNKEFDYPKGAKNRYTYYRGKGGVKISSIWTKIAFSIRFSSLQLLLTDALTPQSRIMFNRTIINRLQTLAPFLVYDSDPYPVIYKGRIIWIVDAYTVSNHFPYSRPFNGRDNYIRNSVKAVVDAYNGTVKFYLIDKSDPVAVTYNRAFPGLFTPFSKMPEGIRHHLRYPETLFSIQANMYATYHMTDPEVFYNKEDKWQIPNEISESVSTQVQPYYIIMKLPKEKSEEFLVMLPFSPSTKNNMIAWIAARSDFPQYGQLMVYDFPKDKLVFGPSQIEARIDQNPEISRQLSLWNQRGSQAIRGNLLVVPIEDSIIYVEPLYLQAEQSQLPELKRVIVGYGNKISMETDFETALADIFTGQPSSATSTKKPSPKKQTTSQLIKAANDHFQAALKAAKNGDWANYGKEINRLGEILKKLQGATKR
jgi:hypothetical protein